jgi:hypothetical protein
LVLVFSASLSVVLVETMLFHGGSRWLAIVQWYPALFVALVVIHWIFGGRSWCRWRVLIISGEVSLSLVSFRQLLWCFPVVVFSGDVCGFLWLLWCLPMISLVSNDVCCCHRHCRRQKRSSVASPGGRGSLFGSGCFLFPIMDKDSWSGVWLFSLFNILDKDSLVVWAQLFVKNK